VITWLLGILIVAGTMALALAGMRYVRRVAPESALEPHREARGAIFGVVGAAYAVLLAFVVVAAWEHYDAADRQVDLEANAVGMLFGQIQALPSPTREALERDIGAYAQTVVDREWPAMADGRASPEAWAAYRKLWHGLQQYRPADAQERAWYDQAIAQLARLDNERGLRLASSRAALPTVLWVMLVLGAALTICFGYLVAVTPVRVHALMIAALSAMLALILFTVVALERPFGHLVPIEPDAFRDLVSFINEWIRTAG
jgi:hypothetical protein